MHLTELAKLNDFKLCVDKYSDSFESIINFYSKFKKHDRIGIVSLNLEDGLFNAGYPILAMVIFYYQLIATQKKDNYPPYFCFVEEHQATDQFL